MNLGVSIKCKLRISHHRTKQELSKGNKYNDKACILPSCPRSFNLSKYINLSLGETSQQFIAFKFVKICVFRTHPSISRFHTEYSFNQISRKCSGTFAEMQRVEMPCNSKGFTAYHCACARDLHGNVRYVIRMLNFVYLSLFLDMSPH